MATRQQLAALLRRREHTKDPDPLEVLPWPDGFVVRIQPVNRSRPGSVLSTGGLGHLAAGRFRRLPAHFGYRPAD
jgi:hypothetical protein